MIVSALEHAERIDIDGDSLRIAYAPEHTIFKKDLEARENRKTIEEVCREVLGRPVAVSVTAGALPDSAIDTHRKEKESLRAKAEADPAVRSLVEKFHGEIVDVVEPDK